MLLVYYGTAGLSCRPRLTHMESMDNNNPYGTSLALISSRFSSCFLIHSQSIFCPMGEKWKKSLRDSYIINIIVEKGVEENTTNS